MDDAFLSHQYSIDECDGAIEGRAAPQIDKAGMLSRSPSESRRMHSPPVPEFVPRALPLFTALPLRRAPAVPQSSPELERCVRMAFVGVVTPAPSPSEAPRWRACPTEEGMKASSCGIDVDFSAIAAGKKGNINIDEKATIFRAGLELLDFFSLSSSSSSKHSSRSSKVGSPLVPRSRDRSTQPSPGQPLAGGRVVATSGRSPLIPRSSTQPPPGRPLAGGRARSSAWAKRSGAVWHPPTC